MKFNTTNAYKPLNVCRKFGIIQELRNVSVAPPDQLQPVSDHIAKQNGRQAILETLAGSHNDRDNSGAGYRHDGRHPGRCRPFPYQLRETA